MAVTLEQSDTVAWVFQGNPDRFNLDGYLAAHSDISWLTPQHRDAMKPGQTVYIWRNAGKSKAVAGIVAVAVVTGVPTIGPAEPHAIGYWIDPVESSVHAHRVTLRVVDRATSKGIIKADWLSEDPICADLPNLRMRQQTNYPIGRAHAERLARLWSKTGRDFDRLDLLIALRAYDATFGRPLSTKAGQPVAEAAILSGRAVTSIYSKVMNFRSLDARVPGAGQANGGEATESVWREFWTGTTIDRDRLDAALAGLLSPGSEPVSLGHLEAEADRATDYSAEGRRRLVLHYRIERDRRVVEDVKAAWFVADPLLRCSICLMSFVESYGELGEGFIEAHHIDPLGGRNAPVVPSIADFAPVCANCHRMVHRREGLTMKDVAEAFAERGGRGGGH